MHKVSIIGAGYVGATAVYYIAEKNLADIVMVDVVKGLPQAKALDYLHAAPMRKYNVNISGTNDYKDIADSDVVVISAGIPRKPGKDQMDLMKINEKKKKKASQAIAEYAPNAIAEFDVVVRTACIPRNPRMDRMDLMKINVDSAKTAS